MYKMNQENNNTVPNQEPPKAVYPKEYQAPSTTADAYTFDYNQIYNVAPTQPAIENNPANQLNNGSISSEQFNPLSNNFVSENNPVTPMNASNVTPMNYDVNASFESLKMAAPPSFELPKEEPKEEVVTPIIPNVQKEDLVSIDIIEPSALPVGNAVRDSMYLNNGPVPSERVVDVPKPVANNQPSAMQMNPFAPTPQTQAPVNVAFGVSQQPQRPVSQPPSPQPVQQGPQAGLVSDPMSIFGVESGLRPTAGEALSGQQQTGVRQAPTPSEGIGVCPSCGFTVKPGQPICVVCGYRFK